MAKYYELTLTAWFTDLATALTDYYGDAVTIHSSASAGVVFSCPQISDKYMRIRLYQPNGSYSQYTLNLYVANSLNTDGTLASATTVGGYTNDKYENNHKGGLHLVLADKFLLMQCGASNLTYAHTILVAQCTNGRYMFIAGASNAVNMYSMYSDTLTAAPIRFISMSTNAVFKSSGKLVLLPSYFATNYEMELNTDGSFAYVEGLFCTSKYLTNAPIVGENYYMSFAPIRGNATHGIYVNNSLYIELEP